MGKLFGDIYGQAPAVKILTAQLESNKLDHAYLFLGSEGLGKTYFAKRFANYLLCENKTEDSCQNCRLFKLGNHPDFIFIDGKNGIKIEQIRNLIERVNLSPNISPRKVVLINNAENLGIEAANALLKTLEEPPLDCIILMTAVSTKSLPETVISRAQKIKLTPLSPANIKKIVASAGISEAVSEEAYSFSEENLSEAKKIIEDPEHKNKKYKLYMDIKQLVTSKSFLEQTNILDEYEKQKELTWLFNVLYYLITKSLETAKDDNSETIKKLQKELSVETRAGYAQKMLKIYDLLKYNVNLRLYLEEMLLEQQLHA